MKGPSKIILNVLLTLLMMSTGLVLYASSESIINTSYRFRHITDLNGLPYTWIWKIDQDRSGYLWFSSTYGTWKYDGYQFEEYSFNSKDTGTTSNVSFVFEDSSGTLWFGTDDGLYEHDRRYDTYIHYGSEQISSDNILCMDEDKNGILWIGTEHGLDIKGHNGFIPANIQERYPVTAVLCLEDGSCIYGNSRGQLWKVKEDMSCQPIEIKGSRHPVKDLKADNDGNIWVATEGSGLFRVSNTGNTDNFLEKDKTLSNDIVRTLTIDNYGNVWAGTEKGITIYSQDHIEFIYSRENDTFGLNDNAVYSLLCDRDGSVWVGTFFGGVNVMNDNYGMFSDLISATGRNELKGCAISSITEAKGKIYIGTENKGLFVYNPATEKFKRFTTKDNGLGNNNVHTVCVDDRNNLWSGNFHGGLNLMEYGTDTFVRVDSHSEIPSQSIYNVLQDRAGNLWTGTFYNGLFRYDYSSGQLVRHTEFPSWIFVWDMLEDVNGDIWLACYGEGIYRLDKSQGYKPLFIETGAKRYITLCELSDGIILAGTEKEGLTAIRNSNEVTRYTQAKGFPENTVYGILQDKRGNIWFSSNSGIYRTDTSFKSFVNYTVGDGLPTNRFNYNACAVIENKLWFGSTDGIIAIDPDKENTGRSVHPISFGNLYVNNTRQPIRPEGPLTEHLSSIDELVLRGKNISWGVDFTSNTFDDKSLGYAYRIDGLDKEWHIIGSRNRIDFTGLAYGHYTLAVCTLDEKGLTSDNKCSLNVFIRPPWWSSTLAKIIYIFLGLAFAGYIIWLLMNNAKMKYAYGLERIAREKDKEINEMKLRFFVNISHEFKTPLALIIGPIHSILEGGVPVSSQERYFNIIRHNAEKLLGLINELLAFRELEHLKLDMHTFLYIPFIDTVFGRYSWLFESKNIRVTISHRNPDIAMTADAGKLDKIVSNLLSNAYKYTPMGGEVQISTEEKDSRIYTYITNSGAGITKEKLPHIFERFFTGRSYDSYSSGIGLSYVKSLVEMHKGSIEAESSEGEYTTLTFWIPTGKDNTSVNIAQTYDPEIFGVPETCIDDETGFEDPEYIELERNTHVLVVDDDSDMRQMMTSELGKLFITESAPNAEKALEIMKSGQVDILVSDVMLGEGMNGYELCRKVKKDIETSHIRVILTTVLSENDYKERGYRTGADAYMVKPYKFSLLSSRIRNLIYNSYKTKEAYKIDIDLSNVEITHSDSDEQLIKRAVAIIFDHLSDSEFGTEELGEGIGMSQSTLYRKLKATTGQSTNEFIQNIRLKYAARLLRETDLTVSEITFDIGFSDSSYFSRAFKKCFGVSPTQWREQDTGQKQK